MAIIQQTDITLPDSNDWLSFTPINAHDLAGVIEPAHQHYARKGVVVWSVLYDTPQASNSSTLIPVGDTTENIMSAHRVDAAGDIMIETCALVSNAGVSVRVERVSPSGARTLISTSSVANPTTSYVWIKIISKLTFADTR